MFRRRTTLAERRSASLSNLEEEEQRSANEVIGTTETSSVTEVEEENRAQIQKRDTGEHNREKFAVTDEFPLLTAARWTRDWRGDHGWRSIEALQ